MAITLAEAKVGMADKVDQAVIDTIQRNSRFMDLLVYDDAISPATGGSTLVYGYTQLKTPASASGRKINTEYVPQEAKREVKHTTLTVMGGSYQIDRVLAKTTNGRINEVTFQSNEKAKATASHYQYLAINGDYNATKDSDEPEFDGLNKLLTGTGNEITDSTGLTLSGTIDEAKATAIDEALRNAIKSIAGGKPTAILANSRAITKLTTVARKLGYISQGMNNFGESVDRYDGIELIDMQQYYNGTETVDVIPVNEGKTDIYIVRIGLDAFCGVTPEGGSIGLETHLPDFSEAKAVHTGDVELVGGVVLKNTKAAAVIRNVAI